LWQGQGQDPAARALLAGVFGWFTEGFETLDLQEAQMLLAELDDCGSHLLIDKHEITRPGLKDKVGHR
jgi:hypothetical protein